MQSERERERERERKWERKWERRRRGEGEICSHLTPPGRAVERKVGWTFKRQIGHLILHIALDPQLELHCCLPQPKPLLSER
jgi:hypothetical protein